MLAFLALWAVPVALAAAFDSAALGLVAVAGWLWAGAAFTVTALPAVPGRRRTLINGTVATGLSTIAAGVAAVGVVGALAGY
ncbi:MAG: hypothetical protein HKN74_02505 [Acidimicrobiia bacterium]|nr:hypothetical protein [Acidimicrobiia bacterium]MBT8217995.1 hypothetical protein [Acidimicrobiia bacterium]NNF09134.1 hypothetical protein [Acidimicrobiia bacterium]NNL70481.1 hypothetical protein [Acidimicrobiia bacterium]